MTDLVPMNEENRQEILEILEQTRPAEEELREAIRKSIEKNLEALKILASK